MSTKSRVLEALLKSKTVPAQTPVEIRRGLQIRRTAGGIPVIRHHYSADPSRDPELNPEWKAQERKTYTSQASWDREQEIVDNAGGGELVFADTLVTYWNKIVITSPEWRPDPGWAVGGGFDHGRTNPTALVRSYVDYQGTIIFAGEYYQPGMEVWQHAPRIRKMADLDKLHECQADPTIFDQLMQQSNQPTMAGRSQERAKSINELYEEQGLEMFYPFRGDRSDISFAARLMMHWSNLETREPTVKIVCRNYSERPNFGLHNWDCPNLLWELMRRRRVKLTAQQLLSRNAAEALVAKDEHASDCMKYFVMSQPEPAVKPTDQRVRERMQKIVESAGRERDSMGLTSAILQHQKIAKEEAHDDDDDPVYIGGSARQRMRRTGR